MQFFNWPVMRLLAMLAGITMVLLLAYGVLVWRATNLRRLGLRNVARRPLRTVLILGGLLLSTTVVGTAAGTGDTITYTLRAVITGSLGSVDEVVARSPRRVRLDQQLQALAQPGLGALALANPTFFPEPEGEQVVQGVRNSAAIAAVVPVIVENVAVVHAASQQLQSNITLLAMPTAFPAAFGSLTRPDGSPYHLAEITGDGIVLNAAAADALQARPGESLDVRAGGSSWTAHVAAVVQNGGLGGGEPSLLVPLPEYQRVSRHEGLVNQLLVANRGGSASIAASPAATLELRRLLVDRPAAQQLHDLLARPEIQRNMGVAEGLAAASARPQLEALRQEAALSPMTDHFISLITDPRIRPRLFGLARALPNSDDRTTAFTLLQSVTSLSVIDIKQIALDQANEYGGVITTIFLVLGIFSLAAAALLIFLTFALLAADRGAEIGTMRALGMPRHQIISMFLIEGMVYNLLGAVVGTALSAVVAYTLAHLLGQTVAAFGLPVETHLAPATLLLTWCTGVLVTFVLMVLAAWRATTSDLLSSIRGQGSRLGRPGFAGVGGLLLIGALLAWVIGRGSAHSSIGQQLWLTPLALSLLVNGGVCLVAALFYRRSIWRGRDLPATLLTLGGLATMGVWLRTLGTIGTATADTQGAALTIAVGGIALIGSTVWTAVRSSGPILLALDYGLVGLPRLRAVVRPAAAYLGYQRWRAGLTIAMFGMVILTMVLATTLIHVAGTAYVASEPPVAGFDLRAEAHAAPLGDLRGALAKAAAVKGTDFSAMGSLATEEGQVVQLGLSRGSWQGSTLLVVDDDFLAGIRAALQHRAQGYGSDAAAWAAVRDGSGNAVVVDRDGSILAGGWQNGATTPGPIIWARPTTGGRPIKLNVVGVVDGRSELDPGIYISTATAAGLGSAPPTATTYFFAVRPELRLQDALQGLQISFADNGLVVTDLDGTFRLISAFRLLLIRVIEGFLGLGLLAGVAALGLLGIQAVLERRQQLGMLRAIGFTRTQISGTLACESAFIAVLGIGVGLGLGLVLAHSLVMLLNGRFGGLRYSVPWTDIALTLGVAIGGSVVSILLTAGQAGRVSPADALRVGAE